MFHNLAALRFHFAIACLFVLSACVTTKVIGDPNTPLMQPGHGLVANSVIFRNPNSAENFKFGHRSTLWHFNFESVDGNKKNRFVIATGEQSALAPGKAPRSVDDDGLPTLLLTQVKPGKYRLTDVFINPYPYKNPFFVGAKNSQSFEVTEGQVTYVGSMLLLTRTRWVGGTLTPAMFLLDMASDFETDIAELKVMEPRLSPVVIKNGFGG